jgi:hypothetical protein
MTSLGLMSRPLNNAYVLCWNEMHFCVYAIFNSVFNNKFANCTKYSVKQVIILHRRRSALIGHHKSCVGVHVLDS